MERYWKGEEEHCEEEHCQGGGEPKKEMDPGVSESKVASSDELRDLFELPEKPSGPNIVIGSSDGSDDDSKVEQVPVGSTSSSAVHPCSRGMSSNHLKPWLDSKFPACHLLIGALQQEAYITILAFSMILLLGAHAWS